MSTDPNVYLERVLEWGADVLGSEGRDPGEALNLARAVEDLDRWLVSGKRLPDRWERARESLTADQAAMKRALKATRAAYSDDSFYGLLHEVSHMIDLDLPSGDFPTINIALEKLSLIQRMGAEVVAHAGARRMCVKLGFPIFPDSVEYAARSTLKFALARNGGESVGWGVEEFLAADRALSGREDHNGSPRVRRVVEALTLMLGHQKMKEVGGEDGT